MDFTIPPIDFTDFQAPKLEPLLSPRSFVQWAVTIITGGISATAEALSKNHRIKELSFAQSDIMRQIQEISEAGKQIESEIAALLNSRLQGIDAQNLQNQQNQKQQLDDLTTRINLLKTRSIKVNDKIDINFLSFVLGIISFVGHMLANWATFGLWGVDTNNTLKNKIIMLQAENDFIIDKFNSDKGNGIRNLEILVEAKRISSQSNEILVQISHTVPGQAMLSIQKVEDEIAKLQGQRKKLEDELSNAQSEALGYQFQHQDVQNTITDLNRKIQELADKKIKIVQAGQIAEQNVADRVRTERKTLARHEDEFTRLQKEMRSQMVADLTPEITKIKNDLGPIPFTYTKDANDKDIPGAIGVDDSNGSDKANWSEYAKRYNDKYTALDILKEAIPFAIKQLLELTQNNRVVFTDTPNATSVNMVFRYIVLDLIEGAKLDTGCGGDKLILNNKGILMRSSQPEKVMRLEENTAKNALEPKMGIFFNYHDDFVPHESELQGNLPNGVDPVSVKWILAKLTDVEKQHLKYRILSPIAPQDAPHYLDLSRFMRGTDNPKTKLIEIAFQLICNYALAMEMKYGNVKLRS